MVIGVVRVGDEYPRGGHRGPEPAIHRATPEPLDNSTQPNPQDSRRQPPLTTHDHPDLVRRHASKPAPAPLPRLAITDEGSSLVLRSTRNHPRRAVRRGAVSCRAVLAAVSGRGGQGRGAGAITAEPSWL